MEFIKSLYNKLLIKNKMASKLLSYFLITTFLMSITSFITYYNSKLVYKKIENMFQTSVELKDLNEELKNTHENFSIYLRTKSTENLGLYIKHSAKLEKIANNILLKSDGLENYLIVKDICNMSFSYLKEIRLVDKAKRGRDLDEIVVRFNSAQEILENINLYIDKVELEYFDKNTRINILLSDKIDLIQWINIILLIFSVFFNILLIIMFTIRLTNPIINLSKSAKEISKGNFNIDKITVDTKDEVSILAQTFNQMVDDIKIHVEDIKEKALLKNKLNEKEMQNLKITSLLKDAELKALQSQINPHFLFNTLNTGLQLAMFEGAEKTYEFMENLSDILRYNLRNLEIPVTLEAEIKNAEAYIFILKSRFVDRVKYTKNIDKKTLRVSIPCLILQPIIENSFIHGISEKEEGGEISLETKKCDNIIEIKIKDNGRGMTRDEIQILLRKLESNSYNYDENSSTMGIGICNVYNRLKLYFNKNDILEVNSSLNNGTEFILKIPI